MTDRLPIVVSSNDWGTARPALSTWLVEVGEHVDVGDAVAELILPGIVGDVCSPRAGEFAACAVNVGCKVSAGDVLGWLIPSSSVESLE